MIIITKSLDDTIRERLNRESLGKRVERLCTYHGNQDRNIQKGWIRLPLIERFSGGSLEEFSGLPERELTLSILSFSGVIPDVAASYREESGHCSPIQIIISREAIVHRQIHNPFLPGFEPYAYTFHAYAILFKDVVESLYRFAGEFIQDIFMKFKDKSYSGKYGILSLSNYDIKILIPYSEVGCGGDTGRLLYPKIVRPTLLDLGYKVLEHEKTR